MKTYINFHQNAKLVPFSVAWGQGGFVVPRLVYVVYTWVLEFLKKQNKRKWHLTLKTNKCQLDIYPNIWERIKIHLSQICCFVFFSIFPLQVTVSDSTL